jgi:peptidoglycan/LPS O-acetylase OafA/YrhL
MPIRNDARASVPETTAVVSRLGYCPQLDDVRGIAIIMVMLVHVHNWPRRLHRGRRLLHIEWLPDHYVAARGVASARHRVIA